MFQLNYFYDGINGYLLEAQSFLWVCGHEDKGYFDNVPLKSAVAKNKKTTEALDNRLIESLKKEKKFKLD